MFEDFVGVYETASTTAETITTIIKDALCRLGLDLIDCRGQAYDGASNMSGRLSGVQAKISADYPKAIYIHCLCHSPNLAVQDSSRNVLLIRKTLDTVQELSNLIHYSPKRKCLLDKVKQDFDAEMPTLKPLCPTRWTVKAKSFESLFLNYEALLETMHVIMTGCDGVTNFEVRSKALGIHSSLQTFDLLCGVMLGEKFYAITDMLSRSLQAKNVTASDAKLASEAICKNIVRLRSDEEFDSFWEKATTKASELQLSDPVLPRNRRPPRRLDSGSNPCSFSSPKDYYRKIYFEFADNIHGELKKRFDQKTFYLYLKAQELLLKAAGTGQVLATNLEDVCKHFGEDLDHSRLKNQLSVLSDVVEGVKPSLRDIECSPKSFQSTSSIFSEVIKLHVLQLLYVLPASTATVERSFSSLHRLKTYLRNSMTPKRLNHLLLLHVHKDATEQIDVQEIVAEFIGRNERRKHCFGNIM